MNYRKKFLFLGVFFAVSVSAMAQDIALRLRNVTVKKAMTELKQKSGYSFVYEGSDINVGKKVNVNANTVSQAVEQILVGQNVTYRINGNSIIVSKKVASQIKQKSSASRKEKVSGTITDTQGEPIIGANVNEKGTKNSAVTDVNGRFTIDAEIGSPLVVSYIGYKDQEVRASNNMQIIIHEATESIDEVVVVGYGTMKKRDLTGSVTSVKMDDEPVGTVSSISHALAGKAAGLQVNTVSAQPGGGATFRIRGAASVNGGNDPLIIIDGFPVNSSGDISVGRYSSGSSDNILASINPNDIESIEVLKDASATAIYGARAGHGVIIVTTKKGKQGNAKVTYSGTVSVQDMAKKYEMLSAHDFMQVTNDYVHENWMRTNGIGIYGGKSEQEASTPYTPRYGIRKLLQAKWCH